MRISVHMPHFAVYLSMGGKLLVNQENPAKIIKQLEPIKQ